MESLKRILFIFLFCSPLWMSVKSQSPEDELYRRDFDLVRKNLLEGKTQEALPILDALSKKYPQNANVSYLLGVCYTDQPDVSDLSIYYLEKAKKDVAVDYSAHSYMEQRAPIFLYYFLVVAYAQNKLCRKAEDAFYQFHSLYGSEKEDFYVNDARLWVKKCELPEELKVAETKTQKVFEKEKPLPKETPLVEEVSSEKKSLITKKVEYSTQRPVYGVQVGSYSRVVPVYKFKNLKNVEAFMDQKGDMRYVVGHLSLRSQAESLLKVIREAGYPDAFIVDVNQEKKFDEELVIYNDQSLYKKPEHKEDRNLIFSVQIGAFRDSIPGELASKYLLVENIQELIQEDLTLLHSGKFKTYADATKHKKQLLQLGIQGSFIIALKGKEKVAIERYMISEEEEE